MKRITGLIITVFLLFPTTLYSDTINVPADYPTIQQAIDAAANGDTLLVAPGTYVENIDFKGKAITVKSSDGPDVTIIDGNKSGSTVVFFNEEGLDSVLEGFTVTNGTGTEYGTWYTAGGGIYCFKASPTIVGNIVRDNTGYECRGGGIFGYASRAIITDNLVTKNVGHDGGGIDFRVSHPGEPAITYNRIENNSSSQGGGINCTSSSAFIYGNIISENNGSWGGGISVYGYDCEPFIQGNLIRANYASGGGGIYLHNPQECVRILNNIICWNLAVGGGNLHGGEYGSIATTLVNTT